jgi:hypothetical protein
MNSTGISNEFKRESASDLAVINRCISLLERRVANSTLARRWNRAEILICLHEIKVSLRNGGNPKYSIKMLLTYCSNFPILSRLANKISALMYKKPLA